MLMKMMVLMQGERGAASEASSGTVGASLEITALLRSQRSEGDQGSKLQWHGHGGR